MLFVRRGKGIKRHFVGFPILFQWVGYCGPNMRSKRIKSIRPAAGIGSKILTHFKYSSGSVRGSTGGLHMLTKSDLSRPNRMPPLVQIYACGAYNGCRMGSVKMMTFLA